MWLTIVRTVVFSLLLLVARRTVPFNRFMSGRMRQIIGGRLGWLINLTLALSIWTLSVCIALTQLCINR